jgi:acetyl esterase/lipase
MKPTLTLLTALLLAPLPSLHAADKAQAIVPSDVRRIEDVIYGHKSGMALTMDVFQPPNPNGCGIIYLVNGGWLSSKDTPRMQHVRPDYYQHFLERGYTVFAVVTSSQPVFKIPDLIKDVHRAVRFIRLNAPRFGVNPDRLGVTGSSSGGHLTLIAATQTDRGNPDSDDPVEKQSSVVRAAACFFPPTDFLNYGGPGIDGCGVGRMAPLAVAFGPRASTESGRQSLGKEISPINYITSNLPPTLIIHGNADETVPLQQSESFVQRAKDAGVKNIELIVREGKGHGWPKGVTVWKSDEDMKEIVDWFDRFLKG